MAKKQSNSDRGGLLFVGCLVIGMGIGFLFDELVAGLFIGMGAGFCAMFFFGRK